LSIRVIFDDIFQRSSYRHVAQFVEISCFTATNNNRENLTDIISNTKYNKHHYYRECYYDLSARTERALTSTIFHPSRTNTKFIPEAISSPQWTENNGLMALFFTPPGEKDWLVALLIGI